MELAEPFTASEVDALAAEYEQAEPILDWRERRRTRRDIADKAFGRLIATAKDNRMPMRAKRSKMSKPRRKDDQ